MDVWIKRLALLALALVAAPAAFADGGRIIIVEGKATVTRGAERFRAVPDGQLMAGDTVETDAASKLQWWLEDDSMFTMGSRSRLTITEFQLNRAASNRGRGLGRLAINLLRGGFRSISGFIGTRNPDAYSVRTPTATMGIRGTDYTAFYLNPADAQALGLEPGTYVQVTTGNVVLNNQGNRSLSIAPGQIGFSSDDGRSAPRLVTNAPQILLNLLNSAELNFEANFFDLLEVNIRIEPEESASPS